MWWKKKEVSRQQVLRVLFNKHQGGFMEVYFKILSVMSKNETSNNLIHETVTANWAWGVMDRKKMFIANQFTKINFCEVKSEKMDNYQ